MTVLMEFRSRVISWSILVYLPSRVISGANRPRAAFFSYPARDRSFSAAFIF